MMNKTAAQMQGRADGSVIADAAQALDAIVTDATDFETDAGITETDATLSSDSGPLPELPSLPGAVILLDAAKGVMTNGLKVTQWTDQSGKGNHARNGAAEFQPELVTVNGMPAVHFSGKTDFKEGKGGPFLRVMDNPSVQFGTADWLITLVVAYTNPMDKSHNGVLGAFFGKHASQGGEILFTGNWPLREKPDVVDQPCVHLGFGEGRPGIETKRGSAEMIPTEPLNDGKVRIISARRFGDRVEVGINGKSDTAKTSGGANSNLSFPGANIGIGSFDAKSDVDALRSLKGDIYFLVVHKGSISDDTLDELESALAVRFHAAP